MMATSNNGVRTLVLVGRTGNGKSATGNTILGRKAFKSRASPSGVTKSCELQKTVLEDGQIINVIDTPGLFNSSTGVKYTGEEILRSIDLANDGIHAILVVFSIKTRFSEEEVAILHCLRSLFRNNIVNYMIIVFTGGDELEDIDETLEDYLGRESSQPLKDILMLCGNRMVLFDNKTKDESKRKAQVQELLSLVNMVVQQNEGKTYTDELSTNMKVDAELKETISKIEQKLAEEEVAKGKAKKHDQEAQKKLIVEICKLKESLEKICKVVEKGGKIKWCSIL